MLCYTENIRKKKYVREVPMRKKRWKRMISILMAGMMVLTAVPVTAQATEGTAETATTVELVNIAGEAKIGIANGAEGVLEQASHAAVDGNRNSGANIYTYPENEGSLGQYKGRNSNEVPYIQLDFGEDKNSVKKIVVVTPGIGGEREDPNSKYYRKCTVETKQAAETAYTDRGTRILKPQTNPDGSAKNYREPTVWEVVFDEPIVLSSARIKMDNATAETGDDQGVDCWGVLNEVEIYQVKTDANLRNITADCTMNFSGDSQNSVDNLKDGDLKTLWVANGFNWWGEPVEIALPAANTKCVKKVVVKLEKGHPNWGVNIGLSYARNGVTNDKIVVAGSEKQVAFDDGYEYVFETPQAMSHLYITLSNPMDGSAPGSFWPAMAEVEIYVDKEAEAETNLQNIAAECTVNAEAEKIHPVGNLIDGDPDTLWASNRASWGEPVEIALPAANTKCVKKVVVKLEKNKPNWGVQIGLSYALNNVTSDKIAVSGSEKQVNFTDGYEYVFETPQAMSHLYITLSNPMDGSAPGQFWPAMAEVEIYVDKDAEEVVELENIAVTGRTKITLEDSVNSSQEKANVADNDDSTSAALHIKNFNEIETDSGTLPFAEVQLNADQKIRQFKLAMKEDTSGAEYGYTLYGKKKYGDAFETIASGTIGTAAENRNAEISVVDLEAFHAKEVEYETLKVIFTAENEQAKTTIPNLAEFQILANKAAIAVPDTENIAWQTRDLHSNYNQDTVDRIVDGNKGNTWTATQYPAYVDIGLGGCYQLSEIEVYTPSEGYSQYSLYYSSDGQNYSKLAEKTGKESCPAEGEKYQAQNVTASSVRILLEYNSQSAEAVLNEVRIKGTRVGDAKDAAFTAPPEYTAPEVSSQDTIAEVQGIVRRNLGEAYVDWFNFVQGAKGAYDYFEIEDAGGKIQITGNDGVSMAMGLNHYLKYFCNVSITQVGNQVKMPAAVVPVETKVRKECKVPVRYAYNYCTMSYSMPFWGEAEWRKELDWLALNGVNLVLDITGQEEVWRQFLDTLGYTHEEIKDYIAGPAFYAWAYMANLSGYGGPVHDSWFTQRTELARKNQLIMKKLGMQPVLQGYSGMVPVDVVQKTQGSEKYALSDNDVIVQGAWCSFQRPYMLRTTSQAYQNYAELFYQCQEEVYGKVTNYYATDPFHEGGNAGGMDPSQVSSNVLSAMTTYDPDAVWVIQAWEHNPSTKLLEGLRGHKDHALVLDLYAEKNPHWTETNPNEYGGGNFDSTPFVFCMLNNFGGRMGLHGHMDNLVSGVVEAANTSSVMKGIGIAPEGSQNNPVLYDLLFETVWCDDASQNLEKIDTADWLKKYVRRRYGAESENAYQAMLILEDTVYKASLNMLGQGAPESYINARPNTKIQAASTWGNAVISYDMEELERAAKLLLKDYDLLKDSDGYLYDVADILKQILSNSSQKYHAAMVSALNAKDSEAFTKASDDFLKLIDKVEEVLGTREEFLLGTWVNRAKALAEGTDDFTADLYEFNAKSLVTTWGGYLQCETGGLRDYSNRQWAGLTKDFYKARWSRWIENQKAALAGESTETINWFELEWAWARANTKYTSTASGADLKALGEDILKNYSVLTPAADDSNDYPVEKMSVHAYGSQSTNDLATNVLDGNKDTIWHTDWETEENYENYEKHYLIFELEDGAVINGLRYLPRQGTDVNGIITEYEISVSTDGITYASVAKGTWGTDRNWKMASFNAESAKYVKLKTVSAQSDKANQCFSSAAEIRLTVPAPEKLAGYTLSLGGDIGVNCYMELSDDVVKSNTAYMQFTLPDGSVEKVPAEEAEKKVDKNGKTYYIFSCGVPAKEMTDTVTAQMFLDENTEGTTYTYTIKKYAEYILEHQAEKEEYKKAVPLIKSMLNYGSYAQQYFKHRNKPEQLANKSDYISEEEKKVSSVTADNLLRFKNTAPQKNDWVKFEGSNLSLLSETTLRLYFTITGEAEDVTFTCEGKTLAKTKSGQYWYVEIDNIPAKNLDKVFTVDVSKGTETLSVNYSVMAYSYNVMHRETTEIRTQELKNVIAALYLYNQEANAYYPTSE